ncbi:MAG: hypothetical protein HY763_13970, partial [Planctomycetes bacterium]|nr:hypothetical protein [Planctomycetota bacterium]
MLGSIRCEDTRLRTSVRGVSRWGTLCGVFAVLFMGLGLQCPGGGQVVVPCDADADCANANFCDGAETCTNGVCTDGAAPCAEGLVCNEDADRCDCDGDDDCDNGNFCDGAEVCTAGVCGDGADPCTGNTPICNEDDDTCAGCAADADCDDGAFCNGAETCTDGACVAGTAPCTDTQVCDETNDVCNTPCDDAGDCDDGNLCTTDACVNGTCESTPVDCPDDGTFCNGTESCDATTGACVSSGDPCAATPDTPTCNEDTDACEAAPLCTTDADCDDGAFCNGIETCDTTTGDCVAGTRPCDDDNGLGCPDDTNGSTATESCSEGDTAAVCTPCPSDTLDFTLAQDNLTGTTGDDTFSAPLLFNPGNGAQIASLQTGDSANGLAGADALNATFADAGGGSTVVPTALAGIESINITYFGGNTGDGNVLTFNATNVSGVDTITSVSSTDDVTITGLQETTNFGMTGTNDANVDMSLTFALAATTSGSTDAISFTVGSTVGTATINIPGAAGNNGFETINIASSGSAANTITAIAHAATSLATAAFTGAQNLTLNTLPNSVRTVNGSAMTGGLTLGAGTAAGAYVQFNTANLISVSGGSGNDTIILNNTLDSNDFTAGTLDLGTGTDVVQATFAADFLSASPFRNVEEARVNATGAATVNF